MSNINIEDLQMKIEKFEKIRANQLKANKKYYEKNKEKITQAKMLKYNSLKETTLNFTEIQKERSKNYYERNKETIRKKNLERYHILKGNIEFPQLQLL
jgi:hypothetical protein